jgi:hypothetical protein
VWLCDGNLRTSPDPEEEQGIQPSMVVSTAWEPTIFMSDCSLEVSIQLCMLTQEFLDSTQYDEILPSPPREVNPYWDPRVASAADSGLTASTREPLTDGDPQQGVTPPIIAGNNPYHLNCDIMDLDDNESYQDGHHQNIHHQNAQYQNAPLQNAPLQNTPLQNEPLRNAPLRNEQFPLSSWDLSPQDSLSNQSYYNSGPQDYPASSTPKPDTAAVMAGVHRIYGAAIGILLRCLQREIPDYTGQQRYQWLQKHFRDHDMHFIIRILDIYKAEEGYRVSIIRKRTDLKSELYSVVRPFEWPGDVEFSNLMKPFEVLRKKAQELLSEYKDEFDEDWTNRYRRR